MAGQHPFDQSTYQVRLEWGVDGLARLAASDIVVVVDVLRFSSTVIQTVERGQEVGLDAAADAVSINGAAVARAAAETGAVVMLGALRNPAAVAGAVLAVQEERAARTSIAVIACGELCSREPGSPLRFAVEDLLGAGAVIAALTDIGIDHSSPEAAAAGEAFRALRGATRHLLAASGSGRELALRQAQGPVLEGPGGQGPALRQAQGPELEGPGGQGPALRQAQGPELEGPGGPGQGPRDEVAAAAAVDAASVVPVLRDGVFVAF